MFSLKEATLRLLVFHRNLREVIKEMLTILAPESSYDCPTSQTIIEKILSQVAESPEQAIFVSEADTCILYEEESEDILSTNIIPQLDESMLCVGLYLESSIGIIIPNWKSAQGQKLSKDFAIAIARSIKKVHDLSKDRGIEALDTVSIISESARHRYWLQKGTPEAIDFSTGPNCTLPLGPISMLAVDAKNCPRVLFLATQVGRKGKCVLQNFQHGLPGTWDNGNE